VKIIYLDQFVLQRAFCPPSHDTHKGFFVQVGELCLKLAGKRVAPFPFSESHLKETAAQLDPTRRKTVTEKVAAISNGYQFVSEGCVLARQATALRKGAGMDWSPHQVLITDRFMDFREQVDSTDIPDRKKLDDTFKHLFTWWQALPKPLFDSIAQREADTYARLFLEDLAKIFRGPPAETINLLNTPHFDLFNALFGEAKEEGVPDAATDAFVFVRDRALEIPSVNFGSKLWASFANSRRRDLGIVKKHPAEDIHFVSCFLPYCNAAFIDAPMSDLLSQSKLFQGLKTRVFSLRTKDEFIKYLSGLESEHAVAVSPESFSTFASERIPALRRHGRSLLWICVVPERPDDLVSAQRLHVAEGLSPSAECNGLAGGGLEWIEELELGNALPANRLVQIIERALDTMLGREFQHGSSSIRVGYFLLNCDGARITDTSDAQSVFVRGNAFRLGVAHSLLRSRDFLSHTVTEMLTALSAESDAASLAK
jgi:hypothetical protein